MQENSSRELCRFRLNLLQTTLLLLSLSRLPDKGGLIRIGYQVVGGEGGGGEGQYHPLTQPSWPYAAGEILSPLLSEGESRGKGWSGKLPDTVTMQRYLISDIHLDVAGVKIRSFQAYKKFRIYLFIYCH